MVKREWLINDLENYVIKTVAEYTVEDQKLFAKDNSFASLKLNDLLADIDSICENILKDPAAAEYPLTEEEFVEILEIAQDYFADKFPTRLYVADRETGTFIEEVKSVADGLVLIQKFEMADIAEDTFENDFYSIVDDNHNTIDIDEALKAEDAYADGDIIFRNISIFKNFLKDCCKPDLVDDIDCDWGLKYWLDKFTLRHGETGGCSFEVSPFDTMNGNPDTIYYDVVYHFFLDGAEVSGEDNDFDQSFDEFVF